jgi:hypothetical protein
MEFTAKFDRKPQLLTNRLQSWRLRNRLPKLSGVWGLREKQEE